jgi:hypothetical protein
VVRAFFENGGRTCHVVRVAAPPAHSSPLPGAGQPIDGTSSLVEPSDGFVPGGVVSVTREAAPVEFGHEVRTVDSLAGRVEWAVPLEDDLWLDLPLVIESEDGMRRTTTRDGVIQPSDRESSLVRSVAGFVPGEVLRVRQLFRRRVRPHRIASVDGGGTRLVWEIPLTPEILSPAMALAAGAGTASTTVLNGQGEPVARVEATSPGAWGNRVGVLVASTGAGATRTVGSQPADRSGSRVRDVSAFRMWEWSA